MMVQKLGCSNGVARDAGMQNVQQERAMAQSGDLRQSADVGKGQMRGADFVMTPAVRVGAFLGRQGVFGALAGGLKFTHASTRLLVSDVRSGLPVAAAAGRDSKTDFSIGGWGPSGVRLRVA